MTTRLTTLDNGLRVVTDTMDTVETVSLGAWVDAGTRNEGADINGVSHFLEHMAFKGTRRRDARAIAEEIEAVGGHLNAYTSRENTAYYAKVLKEDVPLAIDIIADILQNSVMDPTELDRERAVILQEINQSNDTPDDIIFDHFQQTAFPDQAIGRPVLGTASLVRDMKRDTIVNYMDRHYGPDRLVVSAAGKIDHDRMVDLVAAGFDSLPKGQTRDEDKDKVVYHGGDFREHRDLDQVQFLLGLEGIGYRDPDYYALSVFTAAFGGGMSSRLFQEIREKRGLAYSIYAFTASYRDGGLFGIHAGTGAKDLDELIPVLTAEINKTRDGLDEAEIAGARAQLKASILMSLESTSARCEQRTRQTLIFGQPLAMQELTDKIEAVDGNAVQRIAEKIATASVTVAGLGPIDRLESYDGIAARLA